VSQIRRTFVVTVFENGRVAVVEDVQTGTHARVDDIERVGAQIAAWMLDAATSSDTGAARPGH
jgi:hypothetical protein